MQDDLFPETLPPEPVMSNTLPPGVGAPVKPKARLVTITGSPNNKYTRPNKTPASIAGKTQMVSIQRMQAKNGRNI